MALETNAGALAAREAVLAAYLLFWNAERASADGQFSPTDLERLALTLRPHVDGCWQEIFPGRETQLNAWIAERVDWLLDDHLVTDAQAGILRSRIPADAPPAGQDRPQGPLAALWRLYGLYRVCIDAAREGAIERRAVDRIRAELHAQAFMALPEILGQPVGPSARPSTRLEPAIERLADQIVAQGALTAQDRAVVIHGLTMRNSDKVPGVSIEPGPAAGPGRSFALGSWIVEARCPVCRDPLTSASVVSCAECDTPCHADCWSFAGMCPVFACGCTEVVRDGGRPRGQTATRPSAEPGEPAGARAARRAGASARESSDERRAGPARRRPSARLAERLPGGEPLSRAESLDLPGFIGLSVLGLGLLTAGGMLAAMPSRGDFGLIEPYLAVLVGMAGVLTLVATFGGTMGEGLRERAFGQSAARAAGREGDRR